MPVERLGVVGTGLIGASVGLAAKRAGARRVFGYDVFAPATGVALERDAIDEACTELDELGHTDLVVVAVPVSALPTVLNAVLAVDEGFTVSDVGSTKAAVCSTVPSRSRRRPDRCGT
jgi:prephenate dehydrogenase